MVGCVNESALFITAGLGLALSSPGVRYCDLDGHLNLLGDPSLPRFRLEQGWLIAPDVPGLGCTLGLQPERDLRRGMKSYDGGTRSSAR